MRLRLSICALVLWAISNSGCTITIGDWDPPPKPESNWTIADARSFREFPLYWLGYQYGGLPLTYVGFGTDGDGVHHASFWYGEPHYAGDAASGSWLPPLEVDSQTYCGWTPEEFLSWVDVYVESDVSKLKIQGVDAYLERYSSNEANLYVWTANAAVALDTWGTKVDPEQAANDLFSIVVDEKESSPPSLPSVTSTDC